jgi:hypothetical protein
LQSEPSARSIRPEHSSMRRLALLALVSLPIGCADPCVDDGVNQEDKGNCPGQAASAGETESGTSSGATEDASASQTESASVTQASMSATGDDDDDDDDDAEASATEQTSADSTASDGSATGGPGCTNGMVDGDESDVDCGGSCPPCDDGQICNTSTDCESMMCTTDMLCGGRDSCTALIDDNGCQACIKANCCDAVLECFMDEFCHCWVECIEHNNDFDPCVETCMGTGKPGEITSCANSQCNEAGACGG